LSNNMALLGQVDYNFLFVTGGTSGYGAINVGVAFDM